MRYLSVSEYAAAHGISEQAVYKKIRAGKLPTVEREKNGKKAKFIPEEEPAAGTAAAPDAGAAASLAAALAALTEQLKAKDAQIAELTKLLDQAQQLQAHTNRLLELSAHPEAAAAAAGDSAAGEPSEAGPVSSPGEAPASGTPQTEAKRGFWDKIFCANSRK